MSFHILFRDASGKRRYVKDYSDGPDAIGRRKFPTREAALDHATKNRIVNYYITGREEHWLIRIEHPNGRFSYVKQDPTHYRRFKDKGEAEEKVIELREYEKKIKPGLRNKYVLEYRD